MACDQLGRVIERGRQELDLEGTTATADDALNDNRGTLSFLSSSRIVDMASPTNSSASRIRLMSDLKRVEDDPPEVRQRPDQSTHLQFHFLAVPALPSRLQGGYICFIIVLGFAAVASSLD